MLQEKRRERRAHSDFDLVWGEMDRLFEQHAGSSRWQGHVRSRAWRPPTDVYETDDYFLVRVEIAGMREDSLDVTFADGVLRIAGAREEAPAPRRAYHQIEIRYGPFAVALRLNHLIDPDRIDAEYDAGFLTVTLPKRTPGRGQEERRGRL